MNKTKRLTKVQTRELRSLHETGSFEKCTPRTFNALYLNELVCTGEKGLMLTAKAEKLLKV